MEKFKFSSSILSNIVFLIVSLVIHIFPITTTAQMMTIGGAFQDAGCLFTQTKDGGYIIPGWTYSYGIGVRTIYIVKLDAGFNLQWSKTITPRSDDSQAYNVVQTEDGGYAISAWAGSYDTGNGNVYVLKLDASGNVIWTKKLASSNPFYPYKYSGNAIVQSNDGGIVVAASTNSPGGNGGWDVYVAKLDKDGNLLWTRTIGGKNDEGAYSISVTRDGGFVIAGTTNSFGSGGWDVYVLKLDYRGNLQWSKTIGGSGEDVAEWITQTYDGGYVISGHTNSFGFGGWDVYVIKLDSVGNLRWTKTIGGSNDESGNCIIQSSDGSYVISGWTTSFGQGGLDAYVIKLATGEYLLDESAYIQWRRTVGGGNNDRGSSILQSRDGSYVIAGWTESAGNGSADILVMRMDPRGNVEVGGCGRVGQGGLESRGGGTVSSGGAISSGGYTFFEPDVIISSGGRVLMCWPFLGVEDEGGDDEGSTHKLAKRSKSSVQETNSPIQINFSLPYASNVSVRIYNLFGQEIATIVEEYLTEGEHRVEWRPEKYLPPGVYFARIQACNEIMIQKIILE